MFTQGALIACQKRILWYPPKDGRILCCDIHGMSQQA